MLSLRLFTYSCTRDGRTSTKFSTRVHCPKFILVPLNMALNMALNSPSINLYFRKYYITDSTSTTAVVVVVCFFCVLNAAFLLFTIRILVDLGDFGQIPGPSSVLLWRRRRVSQLTGETKIDYREYLYSGTM
jgi:hypothetical protein